MSIYPVHIKTFHKGDRTKLSTARFLIKMLDSKCNRCNKKVTVNNCWAVHSMCYIGTDRIWCSEYCVYDIFNSLLSPDQKVREWAEQFIKSKQLEQDEE